jgi:hypothetical protein
LVPRTPTGYSTIEQRQVYAPADEGEFDFEMSLATGGENEVAIIEPMMCAGSAKAKLTYSKSRNTVDLELDFDHSLPYRMSYTRPNDISTPYNQFPTSVQNGKWQVWFFEKLFSLHTTFYYDPATLNLIGSANDFDISTLPANVIAVDVLTLQMVSSPLFEGKPDGSGHIHIQFAYDHLIDKDGNGGMQVAYLPYNLCFPDQYGVYYTKPLTPAQALGWDDVLQDIWSGYGFAAVTSLEPDPKPAYLTSRDNPMIGWSGTYPFSTPRGVSSDPLNGTLVPETCGTHINPPYPPAFYNFCAAP